MGKNAILKPSIYLGNDLKNLLGQTSKKLYTIYGDVLWYHFENNFFDGRFYIDGMQVRCVDWWQRIYLHYIDKTLSFYPPPE